MLFDALKNFDIILASKSPRRQYLLKELGIDFEIRTKDTDENFPDTLIAQEIPLYLCEKKANAFEQELKDNDLLITADTVVWIKKQVLNKPQNYEDAVRMLRLLSGNKHQVFTGVCLKSTKKIKSFFAVTDVYFKNLSTLEIEHYIKNYNPYDKAGAYGAQEFIGYIAIEKIEGSFVTHRPSTLIKPSKKLYW
jgi:septum formation protein